MNSTDQTKPDGLTPPSNPTVASIVEHLDANLREAFEERAGIMQFDAGLCRDHAECLALLELIRLHPGEVLRLLM